MLPRGTRNVENRNLASYYSVQAFTEAPSQPFTPPGAVLHFNGPACRMHHQHTFTHMFNM